MLVVLTITWEYLLSSSGQNTWHDSYVHSYSIQMYHTIKNVRTYYIKIQCIYKHIVHGGMYVHTGGAVNQLKWQWDKPKPNRFGQHLKTLYIQVGKSVV